MSCRDGTDLDTTDLDTAGRTMTDRDVGAEIWGYCGPCDRWFYCEDWFDRARPCPVCPACAAEPVAIENRFSAHRFSAHRSIDDRSAHRTVGSARDPSP